jgi:hypothetical protein
MISRLGSLCQPVNGYADLNGDGVLDVAVANGGSNNVSVLLGNGDGTLAAPVNYAVGTDPVGIAAGDIEGDGLLDLAVVNHGSNDDTELRNTGGATFLLSQTIPLGESPDAVAMADFNKDGMADQIIDAAPEEVKGEKLAAQTDALAISQDSNASYAAGYSKQTNSILVWNVDKVSGMARITFPRGTTVGAMAFSATDPDLLAVAAGGTVQIYNILSPEKPVATVKYLDGTIPISAIAFSKDGTKLAVGAFRSDLEAKDVNSRFTDGMVWNITIDTGKHTLTVNGAVLVQREQELHLRGSSEVLGTTTLSNQVVQVAGWPSRAA